MLGRAEAKNQRSPLKANPSSAPTVAVTPYEKEDNTNNKKSHTNVRRRRCRKKKAAAKSAAVAPVHPGSNNIGRCTARDLYVSWRCDWKGRQFQQMSRVVMVNWEGNVVFDRPVRGEFKAFKEKVANFIKGKVVIGHGLDYCLACLKLQHNWADLRDCANYVPFMRETRDALSVMLVPRTLEELALEYLNRSIRSVNDPLVAEARVAMDLYRYERVPWENEITVLLRQKETQYETLLEQRMQESLQIIDEAAAYPTDCEGIAKARQPSHYFGSSYEDKSLASTEATLESDTACTPLSRDDTSSTTSRQRIWSTGSSQGLYLEASDSSQALDSTDWKDEDGSARFRRREPAEYAQDPEIESDLLPHHLLDDSFDEAERALPPQEDSMHPVDGLDSFDPYPKRESNWFSLRRRSAEGSKSNCPDKKLGTSISESLCVQDDLDKVIISQREESSHHVEGTDWLTAQSSSKSRFPWRMRLSVGSVHGSVEEASRTDGDTWHNRSMHYDCDAWPDDEKTSSSRFSFFRRKSMPADEKDGDY